VAVEKAPKNSFFFVMKLSDTILLVSVVPIFAPMMIGIALCKSIDPEATSATIIEVVVELLCINAVTSSPIKRLIKGFAVTSRIEATVEAPMYPRDVTSRSIDVRNIARVPPM
jgi:hypothetical protein